MVRFNVRLLKQANDFLYTLDLKTKKKVLLNIKIAQEKNDQILLKKNQIRFGSFELHI